jgi:hypothetical protein
VREDFAQPSINSAEAMITGPGSDAAAWLLHATAGGPHAEAARTLLHAPTRAADAPSRPAPVVVASPAAAFRFHDIVIRSLISGKGICRGCHQWITRDQWAGESCQGLK